MREWTPVEIDTIVKHKLLEVQRHHLRAGEDRKEALIFDSPDWINVIPMLDDGRVVLVRQWRYGSREFSLEVPGGLVEPEESHEFAARRELEEETGYRAGRIERIGDVHPNPALFTNAMSFWLATELEQLTEVPEGDGEEELEVVHVSLDEIPAMAMNGQIRHSLALCAFFFLGIRK